MDDNKTEANVSPKQQVAERVREATNVLVTVRSNPSVDELAAAIGLTLMLNKLGKHATAVFSGQIPSTIEFLKPEETIESNTDSLRDFIVSLDKSKADKLRYKVEENIVKIFITPYRTSITQDDLEFTQGDFNVDVVLALGVTQREELDQAIVSHGRILHDASVVTVIAGQKQSELGNINWQDSAASSLSEMLVSISEALQGGLIDSQIATAFLTGIVSETERFSNTKTSPKVMTMSAQLMATGANQQLIANELQKNDPAPQPTPQPEDKPAEIPEQPTDLVNEDGSLNIGHSEDEKKANPAPAPQPTPQPEEPKQDDKPKLEEPQINSSGNSAFLPPLPPSEESEAVNPLLQGDEHVDTSESSSPIELPDIPGAQQPASTDEPTKEDIHIDHEGNITKPVIAPKHKTIQPLSHEEESEPRVNNSVNSSQDNELTQPDSTPPADLGIGSNPAQESKPSQTNTVPENSFAPMPPIPEDSAPKNLNDNTTLEQIEENVHSPHLEQANQEPGHLDTARDAVSSALDQTDFDPAGNARTDINSQPLGESLHGADQQGQALQSENTAGNDAPPVPPPFMGQ